LSIDGCSNITNNALAKLSALQSLQELRAYPNNPEQRNVIIAQTK
jgi:hypothetical protein